MIFESPLLEEMSHVGTFRSSRPQDILIDLGEYIKSMPLLLKGAIRIIREDKDGNEIFLYYLERGDTCAFSLTCCMGNKKSAIRPWFSASETESRGCASRASRVSCASRVVQLREWR